MCIRDRGVATRGSNLALTQARLVAALLAEVAEVEVELVVVETLGDRRTDTPISALGGQGVFVKEVQAAVLDGRADLAVHSAKDLPSTPTPGLVIAAVPERADPRDALVGSTLDGLAPGSLVATGSVRRRAQLAWLRPDLTFTGLRGNIETRLAKAPAYDAIVVAAAALARLGRLEDVAELLAPTVMVPQVGQGALAVECREDDDRARAALAAVDHGPSHRAVDAERAFLATLGSGCDLPVGAYAVLAAGPAIPTGTTGPAGERAGPAGERAGPAGPGPAVLTADAAGPAAGHAVLTAERAGPAAGPGPAGPRPAVLTADGAGHAVLTAGGELSLTGLLAGVDGRLVLRHTATGTDGPALGRAVATHLLDKAGGRALIGEGRWSPPGPGLAP